MPEAGTLPPYPVERQKEQELEPEHVEVSVYAQLGILWKRKKVLLGCLLVTLSIAFVTNSFQKPVYRSSVEVVLQPKESDLTGTSSSAVSVMQDPTFILTQFRLIQSPVMAERTLRKVESRENRERLLECFLIRGPDAPAEDGTVFAPKERKLLAGAIRGSLSAYQVQAGARLIAISVKGHDPWMVKELADAAAETYIEINYESQIQSFKRSFSFISKSLAEIREKIKTGEMALQKVTSEIDLYKAQQVYGEKHPTVVDLVSTIQSLSEKLKKGGSEIAGMEIGQRKDVLALLTDPHVTASTLAPLETDLVNLKPLLEQEVNTNRDMYNTIFRRLQEVELSGSRSIWSDAKIIEPAAYPSRPVSPNKKMNLLIALLMGIFMGVGIAYFMEYLDSSVRSLVDVRNYLKVFPLGMVPMVELDEEEAASGGEGAAPKSPRPYWNTVDSHLPLYVSEAYRIIRTSLSFGPLDRKLKLFQVTSAVKGEGKTTTACNLGISFAQAGLKTLLVDADMRRPAMHHILELDHHDRGLSTVLSDGESWRNLVRATRVENLYCLPGGVIPPNPAELLSSKKMKRLLEELKEEFDLVLLDSPPIISVADSPIIASQVDGSILVSRSGAIPRHICLHAKKTIESVNGRVVGCILNGVTSQQHSNYYSRYYSYGTYYSYGYYGEEGQKRKKRRKGRRPLSADVGMLEKVKLLKEPFLDFLTQSWSQLQRTFRWGRRA